MAIKLTSTDESINSVKVLVYGSAGVGKTQLINTAPSPIIISAEKGLLTLKGSNLPVIEVNSYNDIESAYEMVISDSRIKNCETICIDSLSDIAEKILLEEKANTKNQLKAYGLYADKMIYIIKKFRDIPNKNIYFTAKMDRVKDEYSGITSFCPSMPGTKIGNEIPYLFDFCFALRIGHDKNNNEYRFLQTQPDIQYVAKVRTPLDKKSLNKVEEPDLNKLFNKVLGSTFNKLKSNKEGIDEKSDIGMDKDGNDSEDRHSDSLLGEFPDNIE